MFGLNKNKKQKIRTHLVIDIGTENLKTILFTSENEKIEIIGYNKVVQKSFAMNKAIILDAKEVLNSLDTSIGLTINQAENVLDNFLLPKKAIVGIAGELISGVPILVNVERDDENEKITAEEIQYVLQKVKEHTFESTKQEIAEENGLNEKQITEIESVVNSVSIDGILTEDPIGLTGKEITYRVFSSFAPKIQLETVNKIIEKLKLEKEKVGVGAYAIAKSVKSISKDPNGAIIIDIGAGTTDVVVVRSGELLGIKMFGIGGRVFTKRIQKEYGLTYTESEQRKLDYSNNKLPEALKYEIKKILNTDVKSWLVGVELALEDMEVDEYPPSIYICGGGALLPDIKEGIMEYPWIQSLNFKKHPRIDFLYPNKIDNVTDLTKSAIEPIDVPPMALTTLIIDN